MCISNALLIFVVVLNYKNMNRQEFCQIIADIRKQSTIKMKDVCFQMGVMPTAIYRLYDMNVVILHRNHRGVIVWRLTV